MKPIPDTRISPHEIPPPTRNGEVVIESEEKGAEAMVIRWATRLNLPKAEIEELVQDIQESFSPQNNCEETIQAVQKLLDLQSRVAVAKDLYIKQGGDWLMADRAMYLLLGMHAAAGLDSLAGLVRLAGQRGLGKAAVSKCLQHFQKQVHELPILPDQRDMEARLKMKKSRKNQL